MSTPSTPLVSVIIPCFRQGRLLAHSVGSILAQTYPRVEIIVVNDGSDDNTDDVARGFGSKIVYLSQPNAGVSAARNMGLRCAQGRYVLFLDADDSLHPEAITRLMEAANGRIDVLAVMGFAYFSEDPAQDAYGGKLPPSIQSSFPWLLMDNLAIQCYLAPLEVVNQIGGFDESLRGCEDWDLWLRLALRGLGMATLPWVGGYYRRYPGSVSTNTPHMTAGMARLAERFFNLVRKDTLFLKAYGPAWLGMLHYLRLHCKAMQNPPPEAPVFGSLIKELHARGIRARSPFPIWVRDRLPDWLGRPLDSIGLAALKCFAPSWYRSLAG